MATILVVDDEPAVRHVVQITLETRNHAVRVVEDGKAALAVAVRDRPDLIVLDWMLPDMTGLAVCQGLRANPNTAHIPIIFLTAVDDVTRKIAGLDAGADDYVTKPFEPLELLARINVQLRKALERGQVNPLTGLPGNALIEKAIRERLDAPDQRFAVLYFDLNEFKAYNDFFGFSWGDQLLKMLAVVLQRAVLEQGGTQTFLGHIGGDDFVAIAHPDHVAAICDQAIAQFDHEAALQCAAAGAPHGFVGQDRGGTTRRFGPPGLSIGVVTNEHHTFTSYLEVGQMAAQVKRAAKRYLGSTYFVDRRREADPPPVLGES